MKEKTFVVNIVEGTEFESVTVRDPRTAQLLYAGNKSGFLDWFNTCMEVPSESSSNIKNM